MPETDFLKPQYYTNRELSWLDFDVRILEEARDKENPLFERMKFLSITASNLDEFFMVRVASLKDQVNAKYNKPDLSGMTPSEQIDAISLKVHDLVGTQYSTYNRSLLPALKNKGLQIYTTHEELTKDEKKFADEYFDENVFPVLTPMAMDSSRPFPLVRNKTLNIGVLIKSRGEGLNYLKEDIEKREKQAQAGLEHLAEEAAAGQGPSSGKNGKDGKPGRADESEGTGKSAKAEKAAAENISSAGKKSKAEKTAQKEQEKSDKASKHEKSRLVFATVQVPSVLPRFIELPRREDGLRRFILLEELIRRNISKLYMGYEVICAYPYRIMRNAELGLDEDEAEDLLKEIEKSLRKRQWGEVIRLEVEDGCNEKLLKILKKEFGVRDQDVYEIPGPLDLTFLMKMYGLDGFDGLKEKPWTPQPVPALIGETDLFEAIRRHDIFLHHPYMTFDPVVNFVRQASRDPQVLAIKQTLYRVSGHSPIVAALAAAAENGKQVTVLVELKARFDEENNIVWAKMLEKAGCHVIYGLVGLKTHCKITLVVRREEDGIRRYVHLGTGNYNDSTAKLYTDCGIMTCSEPIGEDATAAFNMLSGYSEPRSWNRLALAPIWLRNRFMALIRREAEHAREGKEAHIIAKMNSLCDQQIIAALYAASAAGVKIDLIVRGICCLRVGIPGVSENITVRSIVGTFLEHARIFYFQNDTQPEIFMASADWMPRNLDKRVEIMFPVEDPQLAKQVKHILDVQLADTMKARQLTAANVYERIDRRGKPLILAQTQFCEEAKKNAAVVTDPVQTRVFTPAEPAADPEETGQDKTD